MEERKLTIGELAKRSNTTVRALRYYDNIGLLKPTDYKEGGHRLYSIEDYKRLQQIQSLKFLGFSLKNIEELLAETLVEQQDLTKAIDFKTRELLAQQQEIQRTINQLKHMKNIIVDKQHIDLNLFCFVLYAIIWEEENIESYSDGKDSLYNLTNKERLEFDKTYFDFFTRIKHLVASEHSPDSKEAQELIGLIIESINKIVAPQEQNSGISLSDNDVFNPLTNEEITFLKKAKQYYLQKKG